MRHLFLLVAMSMGLTAVPTLSARMELSHAGKQSDSKLDGPLRRLVTSPATPVVRPDWGELRTPVRIDLAGRALVEIRFVPWITYPEAALTNLGVAVQLVNNELHAAQGLVPIINLEALSRVPWIEHVRTPLPPLRNQGSALTQGDGILAADTLRGYGLNGTSVKVGVISDGIEGRSSAQASGDLPLSITEFGGCTASVGSTCAEGTAMLEIIHDIAPGAELGFCGPQTTLEMVNCYAQLGNSFGASVIVDDLGWPGESMFTDGDVADTAASMAGAGKLIVSAAGNNAIRFFEADYTPTTTVTSGTVYQSEMNFGLATGNASDPDIGVTIPPGESGDVYLQWNEPYGAAAADYDLLAYYNGSLIEFSVDTQDGNDFPFEVISLPVNNTGSPVLITIVVARYSGADHRIKMLFSSEIVEYYSLSGQIYGQAAAPAVIAVGAIDSNDPGNDEIEYYSSRGPVRVDFPSVVQRMKPDISGIDNVTVTGAGGFGSSFAGTSAAAPHIAGLLALLRGTFSGDVRGALLSSATDLGVPGRDNVFGYGRANAMAAAEALNQAPVAMIVSPTGDLTIAPGGSAAFQGTCVDPEGLSAQTFAWTFSGTGISSSSLEDPGTLAFPAEGNFLATFRCADALFADSPTVARAILVQAPATAASSASGGGGSLAPPLILLFAIAASRRRLCRNAVVRSGMRALKPR